MKKNAKVKNAYETLRKPVAKPTVSFKDKSKYNRKQKHSKKEW